MLRRVASRRGPRTVGPHAGPAARPAPARERERPGAGAHHDQPVTRRRRFRAPACQRVDVRGRGDRAARRGAGAPAMDARGRHAARLLPRRRLPPADGGSGCARTSRGLAAPAGELQRRRQQRGVGRTALGPDLSRFPARAAPAEPDPAALAHALRPVARARLQRVRLRGAELPARAGGRGAARPSRVPARTAGPAALAAGRRSRRPAHRPGRSSAAPRGREGRLGPRAAARWRKSPR